VPRMDLSTHTVPDVLEKFFATSIKAFPGNLSASGKFELMRRLWVAALEAAPSGKLGIFEEADRKKLRAILKSTDRKLAPLMKRYPIIAQHIEFPPMWLMRLTNRQRKAKEPHTVLLHGIFTAYDETQRRYPDCKAPAVGLNTEFRKFLDAVLVKLGLGPIGDKFVEGESRGPGMIGEGELKGAWRTWKKAKEAAEKAAAEKAAVEAVAKNAKAGGVVPVVHQT
jgi:hypothetical protein